MPPIHMLRYPLDVCTFCTFGVRFSPFSSFRSCFSTLLELLLACGKAATGAAELLIETSEGGEREREQLIYAERKTNTEGCGL